MLRTHITSNARAVAFVGAMSVAVAAGQVLLATGAYAATTLIVSTTADVGSTAGACGSTSITTAPFPLSLREATCLANNIGGAVTITVPAGTYHLTNGEIQVGKFSGQNVTVTGAGAASTVIDAGGLNRVVDLDVNLVGGVTVAISGVTISGGNDNTYGGAGIIAGSANAGAADVLTIDSSIITNNHVPTTSTNRPGGAVQFIGGSLTITNTAISNNSSGNSPGSGVTFQAQGIVAGEHLTISNTTFSGNTAVSNVANINSGGALELTTSSASSTFDVTNSRFVNNSVTATGTGGARGAAIFVQSGTVTVTGSTFTGNAVSGGVGSRGGAIAVDGSAVANVHYSRFAGNTAPVGGAIAATTESTGSAAATDNWWGCNGGPNTTGCDATSGVVTATPNLKLTATAAPSTVTGPNGTSTVTASLTQDSAGTTITAAQLTAFAGLPVAWGDPQPSGATVSSASSALTSGAATTTYNSHSAAGSGHVTATLDNTTMTATLLVNQVPAISSAASTTFALGQAGSFTVTTTGYPLPAITKSGALPSGVAFVDNGDGTATLSGTPAAGSAGVYSLSVTAANGVNPAATQTLTLTVGQAPAFTSAATATFTAGTAGSATVTTSGAPAATITATGSLPNGVTFVDNGGGTATLSGTPAAGTGGTYPLTLSASNGVGPNAAQSFTLTVREAPTVTAQPSAQTVYPGDSATFTAAASGTPTPTVQWQRSTNGGTSFGDVAGATSPTYTFATVSTDDGNRYRAVFTNAAGTVQTSVVTLTVGTGPLTAVVITPSASSVAAGAAASYTADGRDVRGNSLGDATVATTFTIAAAGSGSSTGASCVQATGGSPASCSATIAGTYTVTGVDGAAADTATLTVTAGPLATLTVSPASSSIAAGTSRTYAASGADAYGNSLGDVTSSTTFTIAPSSGGSPTGAGCTTAAGCTATIVGTYTVTGTDGSVTGVATLAVTPSALASLSLTPPTASVSAGTAQSYAVTGADAYGNTWGDVTSASSFTIAPATGGSAIGASCGTNGSCTATAAGDYTVTATDGGVTGTAGVTIVPSSLASITVSPGTASAAAGAALPYAATGADTYGNSLGDVTAATVFTIAPSGTTGSASGASCTSASLCTATAVGSYTVTGTDGAVTATATVTVTPAPLAALVISPAAPSAVAGTSTSFTAEGVDAYGNSRGDDTGVTTFTIAPAAGGSAAGAVCTGAACTATATGGYTIAGADGAATGTAQLTVTAAAAASITATSGGGQIAYLGSPFAQPLVATVLDAFGNPVPGSVVTFTVPAAGGGNGAATFPGALTTVSVTTGADGVATSPALVAGASAGAVVVSAAIGGSAPSVTYPASSVVAVVVPTPTPTPTPNPTPPPTRPSAPKGPSGIGTAGTVTVITGTTTPGARVELYGFTVPSTTYHLLGWTRANAVGHYSFLPRFTGNSRVYVRVAGLTSPSIVVRVRSLVTLSATKLSPRTYTFSGASLPARAGELVVLYYRDRFGHALVVARAHADGHGHYSVTHTFTDYGRHSYGIFAVVSSDARAVWATSRTDAITTYRAY